MGACMGTHCPATHSVPTPHPASQPPTMTGTQVSAMH
jgi:hypothetical protein